MNTTVDTDMGTDTGTDTDTATDTGTVTVTDTGTTTEDMVRIPGTMAKEEEDVRLATGRCRDTDTGKEVGIQHTNTLNVTVKMMSIMNRGRKEGDLEVKVQ